MDNANDHDLLIELRTEVRGMREDVKTFSNDTKERIVALESRKLDIQTHQDFYNAWTLGHADHEKRLRSLERWGWAALGVSWAIQIGFYIYLSWRGH